MGLRSPKNCFLGFFFHLFKWGKIYKTLHYSLLMCTCICASPWLEAGACDVSHVYTFVRVFVYVYTCVQRVHVCIQYVIKIRKIYRKITFFNGKTNRMSYSASLKRRCRRRWTRTRSIFFV
jgi:hypothetical protein